MRIGTCTDCGNEFPHEKVKGFLPKRCVACQREFGNDRMRRWREAHPARTREITQKSNAKRLADPDHRRIKRENETRRRYNVEPEQLRALIAAQNGRCAICKREPGPLPVNSKYGDFPANLHVDHDHKCCPTQTRSCGKCVRGLLCSHCNAMLGLAGDSPAVLAAAIEYLTRF